MKKLLHERARDFEKRAWDGVFGSIGKDADAPIVLDRRSAANMADEIETDYQPKPRDTEGNPVHEDMEVEGGTVFAWRVWGDGSWAVLDSSYITIQCGGYNDPIRLPVPTALDANGVPTKKGDRVWDLTPGARDNPFWGGELWVVDITKDNIVVAPSPKSGATMEAPARCFSHARPQYDRDGVLCKPGDTVFGLGREQHRYKVLLEERDVEKCEPYDHGRFTLPCLDLTDGDECVSFLDPRMVSHKEPGSYEELQEMLCKESSEEDSYKKVRDDLLAAQENWDGDPNNLLVYADRITALMEQER